jgi:DNA-binding NarL/FixJ family response regulator
MTDEPIRVLVVDDHPVVRDGMRMLFDSRPEVAVVGEAAGGTEAVELARRLRPDVVIMDVQMPGLNGIDATRQLIGTQPGIGVLVVTMYDDDDTVFGAMQAGARGYLLKGAEQDEIVRAVAAVARGEAIFGAPVASRIVGWFASARPRNADTFSELTSREREILDLVAAGANNATISSRLCLSSKTVANHVSNILTKLQLSDRAAAIVRARDAGLGQL